LVDRIDQRADVSRDVVQKVNGRHCEKRTL
jgi:hypothetical protein